MDNVQLVNNIRNLCTKNDISVSQLEKVLNLSNGLISRWKDKTPTLERLIDIAQFFNVTLDDLIGGVVEQEDDPKISYLVRVLHQETKDQKIKWGIFDFDNPPIKSLKLSYDVLDKDKYDYYYAVFENGFFLIGFSNFELEIKISLYVVPDYNSFPELVCSDAMQLLELFDLVANNLKEELNKIKTDKYIDKFLSSVYGTLKPNSLDKFLKGSNNGQIYKFG